MEFNLYCFPRFSFCASALEKRGPFRLIVKLIQIILSLIHRESIDWRNSLPGLKASMVPTAPTWEHPQPFFWRSLCLNPVKGILMVPMDVSGSLISLAWVLP